MDIAEFHALSVGDEITVTLKVTKLFPEGTLGWSRGWIEAALVTDGLIGEQKLTVAARDAEVKP